MDREFRVIAARQIETAQVILPLQGFERESPDRYTIQVGSRLHLDAQGSNGLEDLIDRFPWRFLNHSCDANGVIQRRELVAVRPIAVGEEVTFNYNTTEYELAVPFRCRCRSACCVGEIRGFRYLFPAEKERLRPLLSPHLSRLMDESCHVLADAAGG